MIKSRPHFSTNISKKLKSPEKLGHYSECMISHKLKLSSEDSNSKSSIKAASIVIRSGIHQLQRIVSQKRIAIVSPKLKMLLVLLLAQATIQLDCQPNCESCFLSQSQVICRECQKHYAILKNNCIKCEDPNCEVCASTDTSHCLTCANKFFVLTDEVTGKNSCNKCIDGCWVCEDVFSCDECQFGYTNANDGTCTFDFVLVPIAAVLICGIMIAFICLVYKLIESQKQKYKARQALKLKQEQQIYEDRLKLKRKTDRKSRRGNVSDSSSSSDSDSQEEEKSNISPPSIDKSRKKIKLSPNRKFKEDEELKINLSPDKKTFVKNDSMLNPRKFESLETKSNENKSSARAYDSSRYKIAAERKLSSSPSIGEQKIEEIKSDDEIKDKSRVQDRNNEETNIMFSKLEELPRVGYVMRKKSKSARRSSNRG